MGAREIVGKWWESFKPDPQSEKIEENKVDGIYRNWRIRIFYSMFIGYTLYYFSRKSYTVTKSALITDLAFSKSHLGILDTLFAVTYGFGKFTSGILADRSNARVFMGFGLILTGLLNILFGLSSSFFLMAIFWSLNGAFQSFGWPPCARLLTHWYSQKERGTWWSLQNVSHNVGGSLIPLIAAYAIMFWGWRYALYVPGIICVAGGLFLLNRLRDTPQSLGLPPVEEYRQDWTGTSQAEVKNERELSMKEALFEHVLKNPYIWFLAFAYFFIYVARMAFNDWSALYLIEHKDCDPVTANLGTTCFEIGGFIGSLAAGFLSDYAAEGKRGPVNVFFTLGLLLSAFFLWNVPPGFYFVDLGLLFAIGFFVFGPQMLIGLAAADMAHKKAAASATGFVGLFAYMGAAFAGFPLAKIAEDFGWNGFFLASIICIGIAGLMLLPTFNAQKEDVLSSI